MNVKEFSNEFDTLIQANIRQHDFGTENILSFDEYEKSIFLTKAQELLVLEIYTGKGVMDSFESTEEVRRYLFPLVDHQDYTPTLPNGKSVTDNSYFVVLDNKVLFIIYEEVTLVSDSLPCKDKNTIPVEVVSHDTLHTTLENPFRGINDHRVLRLDSNVGEGIIELISKYPISKYSIRFLSKPSPIILTDLGDVSIDGISTKTECLLSPILHRTILQKAVHLALQSKAIKLD